MGADGSTALQRVREKLRRTASHAVGRETIDAALAARQGVNYVVGEASGEAFTFKLGSEYRPSEKAGESRAFVTPKQRIGARQSMGSARRLLLAAALAFAIATDARTDATLSTLTLSPDTNSLITTRDESTATGTSSSTTAIGSAASDTHKVTKAPDTNKVTEAPETEPPATTAPPITSSSESNAASASDSSEQDTTDAPSSASATVSPGSTSDRSNLDSESQKDATSTSKSTASKSTTASVDTLNSSGDGLSSGSSASMGTTLPVVCGILACVGAIVMAVTYKKKRTTNGADSEGNRPSSDCEYTSGADFTPDNRALSIVHEDSAPIAVKVSGLNRADVRPSAAIADFTGTNSSVCSSPFGSSRGNVRVSSPVQSGYSSSEANMEFQDTSLRHHGGSNVVLTFEEVPTDSSHAAPQVQL